MNSKHGSSENPRKAPRRKGPPSPAFPSGGPRLFAAVREKWSEGYSLSDVRADLLSGTVVAMVAIPLGMALAIASGVPPQHGLYTVIVAGAAVALLGGSRFQVTGPTAAFVVILAPIVQKFGLEGLLLSGLMAGILLVIMGWARMGKMIQFIPYPVTTGFTTGIAVVIATLQLKDFFGLRISEMPEGFPAKAETLFQARGTFSPAEFVMAGATLLILVLWPRINKRVPAPLAALTAASIAGAVIKSRFPEIEIATIGSRFTYEIGGGTGGGIPPFLPRFELPFQLSLETLRALLPSAFAIAMLGAIESLLSAVVADGMAQTRHDPDSELVALGVGNILCPFFGGIAATGAIARTATNIRFGARSPFSAVFHALLTLIVVLVLAPYVSHLPMAALAALLMLVAYNMSEARHFLYILRVAPRSDVAVLLLCFLLTVIFDMVVGVAVGVVLAALMFMKRMASVTSAQVLTRGDYPRVESALPEEAVLYGIKGPLFFGAAQGAARAMTRITDDVRAVVFLMDQVPVMDITGLVAFESAVRTLTSKRRRVFIVGLNRQPRELLEKGGSLTSHSRISICDSMDEAVEAVNGWLSSVPEIPMPSH